MSLSALFLATSLSGGKGLAKNGFLGGCEDHQKRSCGAQGLDLPLVLLISMSSKLVLFLRVYLKAEDGKTRLPFLHPFHSSFKEDALAWPEFSSELRQVAYSSSRPEWRNPSHARTKSREINARFWSFRNLKRRTWKVIPSLLCLYSTKYCSTA